MARAVTHGVHTTAVLLFVSVFPAAIHSILRRALSDTTVSSVHVSLLSDCSLEGNIWGRGPRCPAPGARHAASRFISPSLKLRGGNSDEEMKVRLEILDEWDMMTQQDELGMNVTMLQSRIWPYCIIELWWESLGKFRFTYDEPAEDIMCAFPQGSTSNMSGWDIEELAKSIRESRGMATLPDPPLDMGSWKMEVNGSLLLITNKVQPENHLFVTDRGFYFFDKVGYALKTEGNLPPIKVRAVNVCEEVGLRREDQKIAPVEEDYQLPPKDILDGGYS